MNYPNSFENLINCFKKLPGVGTKTAERYAFQILDMDEEQIQNFMNAIDDSYHKIHACKVCGSLTENDTCDICNDSGRNQNIICVVTDTRDVIAMERVGEFHGVYHVLGGEISTTKGILPENLRIKELLERINENTEEIILATNPTVDGETTALYLGKLLGSKGVTVTRIAHGLPMGGHLDYADELTLSKAIEGRIKI